MGTVVRFTGHSAASPASAEARASNVICAQPLASANLDISSHRRGGMPRSRHVLTVDAGNPSAVATAPVPPRSLIAVSDGGCIKSNIIRTMRTCQVFATRETTILVNCGPIDRMDGPLKDPPEVIGPRLKALRLALEIKSQTAFAKSINVEKNTYNPWEKGSRELTFEGALLIRRKHKIPLEYLFFGEFADELPYRIRRRLDRVA